MNESSLNRIALSGARKALSGCSDLPAVPNPGCESGSGAPSGLVTPSGQPIPKTINLGSGRSEEPVNKNAMMIVEGMVNRAMLEDTSMECKRAVEEYEAFDEKGQKIALKAPSPEDLQKMQDFAFNFKKRNPLASEERVVKAVANHFNIHILRDDEAR